MALTAEQRQVLSHILAVGWRKGASQKQIKAAIETGLVESNLRNLPGGDADSAGWRQERASLYRDPTNLDASIGRFFDETAPLRGKYGRAGDLAAAVQRPAAQYRGRYQQRSGEADALFGGRSARSASTTRTIPGTDNSAQRAALIQSFLSDQHADPVDFALGIKSLQDTPGRTVTTPGSRSAGGGIGKKSPLFELFWQGPGGIDVKNGRRVPQGFVSGHQDHVHVAAGPKTVVALGKLAQRMGLRVGENSHFTGRRETSGHAPNSYHYRDEAIDASGDPRREAAFARRVARLYGIR